MVRSLTGKAVVRTAFVGLVLLLLGVVAVATGVVPASEARVLADRVWPILLFVVAITVVTELAAEAELFRVVAERAARWGLGWAWLLWLFVVVLAVTCTVFLSLDTTAVLLTPVVVLLARHVGVPPLPFALTTIWLANTASLLLPVSNLTNLLAQHVLGFTPLAFASLMALPALVAIVIPCAVLFLVYRRQLTVRYTALAPTPPRDRMLFWVSAVVVVMLVPAFISGIPVWIPSTIAAVVLASFFAARSPATLSFSILPWKIVVLASGLFLVVTAANLHGLSGLLTAVAGTGDDPLSLLQLSFAGAAGSNVVNNLPAYLALEPVTGSPLRTAALLIGANAGPLITPWASLATLLWHERLVALGVHISWWKFMGLGLVVAPVTVLAATLALSLH